MGAQSHGRWLDGVTAIGLRGLMEKLSSTAEPRIDRWRSAALARGDSGLGCMRECADICQCVSSISAEKTDLFG
jgi:hypothetical protein